MTTKEARIALPGSDARWERLLSGAVLGLWLLLAGCTGTGEGPAASGAPDGSGAEDTVVTAVPPSAELFLGLTEWSIETGGVTVLPGTVRVQVMNTGATDHDVIIEGEEGRWGTPVLGPGETHELEITAVPGEKLHLICSLTGHESSGMHASIPVAEAGGDPGVGDHGGEDHGEGSQAAEDGGDHGGGDHGGGDHG